MTFLQFNDVVYHTQLDAWMVDYDDCVTLFPLPRFAGSFMYIQWVLSYVIESCLLKLQCVWSWVDILNYKYNEMMKLANFFWMLFFHWWTVGSGFIESIDQLLFGNRNTVLIVQVRWHFSCTVLLNLSVWKILKVLTTSKLAASWEKKKKKKK